MTMWGGRFSGKLDPAAWALNASIGFDRRMALQDVRGSTAWAKALQKAGVLTSEECDRLCGGLDTIGEEFEQGSFGFQDGDEDIHSAVERRLGELVGALAGKLHTGRSRNDQVATDFRLWVMEASLRLDEAISGLQRALLVQAEAGMETLLPGYTHLQRAQPILLAHWWLAHFWPLQRDRQRLAELRQRAAVLPLGSGALAGTPFPVDREALANELGFHHAAANSIDAVADRDFAAEYLFTCALTGVHLSRLAESVILYASAEFGFFELSDAYATGSSLMPQKKNPDVFELARGKTGRLVGSLAGLLVTLKGLPSAYDKDLQEDKQPVFEAFDTLFALLGVLAGAVETLRPSPERMVAAIDAGMMATDLSDYLVARGVPFREAHHLAGQAVQRAQAQGVGLDRLSLEEWHSLSPLIDDSVHLVFDPWVSVGRRAALGGTAPQAVRQQLDQAARMIDTPGEI